MRTVDYRPLTMPVSAEQRRSMRVGPGETAANVVGLVVAGFITIVTLTIAVPIVIGTIGRMFGPPGLLVAGVVAALIVTAIVFGVVRFIAAAKERAYRLTSFATANGMLVSFEPYTPSDQGAIFGHGSDRRTATIFRSIDEPALEVANYRYTTGSGKNRTTHHWGYLRLQLERRLPHLLLDARGNNGLFGASNLPSSFGRDQRLSLEGDFDEHFTLYCPKGYETDALYVFTPDLMALLIDNAGSFDVEIIDDRLYVYRQGEFEFLDATTWARLFAIVDTVGAKTLHQTARYRDDRVGAPTANVVAPAGRRLRTGGGWLAVVLVVAIAGFWLWTMLAGW